MWKLIKISDEYLIYLDNSRKFIVLKANFIIFTELNSDYILCIHTNVLDSCEDFSDCLSLFPPLWWRVSITLRQARADRLSTRRVEGSAFYWDHIITAWRLLIQILATKRDERILQIEKQSLEEVSGSWRAGKPLTMACYLNKIRLWNVTEPLQIWFNCNGTYGTMRIQWDNMRYETFLILTH